MDIGSQFQLLNTVLGIGTLFLMAFGIALLIPKLSKKIPTSIIVWTQIVIAATCFIFPLVYEFYFGFPPCTLCWFIRILSWPTLFIFPYAYFMKEHTHVTKYLIPLCIAGIVIAGYQYGLQFGVAPSVGGCTATGVSESCSNIQFLIFGFITIPFMALVSFIVQLQLFKKLLRRSR